jgi:hypothetical protein
MDDKEYPLYPSLTEDGKKEAQMLMDHFSRILKTTVEKMIQECQSEFYTDILNEVESDHWQNYRTKIINALCDYRNKKHSVHDFDRIRESIYRNHKDLIIPDLNQDLLKEIESLKQQLKIAYENRF